MKINQKKAKNFKTIIKEYIYITGKIWTNYYSLVKLVSFFSRSAALGLHSLSKARLFAMASQSNAERKQNLGRHKIEIKRSSIRASAMSPSQSANKAFSTKPPNSPS